MAEARKAIYRIVIAGSQEAIFRELTATDRPLGATFNGLPVGTKTATEMERGGMFIVNNLKSIVETGRPPLGTRLMYALFGALEFVLPKKTKSENWPLRKE